MTGVGPSESIAIPDEDAAPVDKTPDVNGPDDASADDTASTDGPGGGSEGDRIGDGTGTAAEECGGSDGGTGGSVISSNPLARSRKVRTNGWGSPDHSAVP